MRGDRLAGGTWPLVLLLGLGAASGVVAWLVLSHNGHPVRPWLVLALCVTGGVVAAVLRVVTVQVPAPGSAPTAACAPARCTDRERGGVARLARYAGERHRERRPLRPAGAPAADPARRPCVAPSSWR